MDKPLDATQLQVESRGSISGAARTIIATQESSPPHTAPPEFGGTGAMTEGLADEWARNKTARMNARALRKGWVTGERREKAVDAAEWLIETGKRLRDPQTVNHGVRGILAAEANDLKRVELEDKIARLDAGTPTDNHSHTLSVIIEPVKPKLGGA